VELRRTEKSTNNKHPIKPGRFIMVGSILSVHIINAENLSTDGEVTAVVKAQVKGQRQVTSVMRGKSPVWNEILTFDIVEGTEVLKLSVEDKQSGQIIG
jgi:hypothetical protein